MFIPNLPPWLRELPWRHIRRWLYAVLLAIGALALFYGWLQPQALPLWAGVALALLNTNPPPLPTEAEEVEL